MTVSFSTNELAVSPTAVQRANVNSDYNIFRWYRAGWGRYTQADPIGLQGALNLFAYALDNPSRFIDATGLKVEICCRPVQFAPNKWS